MSTTNREKRKQAKRKARERKGQGRSRPPAAGRTQRSEHYARGGAVDEWARSENPPAPDDAERVRVVVVDAEGLSCDTGAWPLRMLEKMDASVWAEHEQAGSLHLTERGRRTGISAEMWARFDRGGALTFAATGPDAGEALERVRDMLAVPPEERKELYRARYLNTSRATGAA